MGGIVSGNISTAMAYVSDSTNEEKRAKWLGYIGASVSIGFMTGPAIGGYWEVRMQAVPAYFIQA
jgi:MFS family permease